VIPPVVLQSCEYGQDMAKYLENFQFVDAFQCQFSGVGIAVAGLMLMSAVFIPLFIRSRSPVIPLVLLLLVGGAFVQTIAGAYTTIAVITLLAVGGGGLTLLYARYSA
jgi:hypothetical protein